MFIQQDSLSIYGNQSAPNDSGQESAVPKSHKLTPKEVLSWLPSDATPAQQDSAIQHHFKPSKINWSKRPDTLHMPGTSKGSSIYEADIPQYYRNSFFSESSYYHPEISGDRQGVTGDPVPYNIATDNIITIFLIGSFILTAISIAYLKDFIARQAKTFFRVQRGNKTDIPETSAELWMQFFLVAQCCLLLALIYFLYAHISLNPNGATILSPYLTIGVYAAILLAYFFVKLALHLSVGWVFFDMKKNQQWDRSLFSLIALEGVLLFPIVLLMSYFNLSINSALIYVIIVLVLIKILAFYRLYIIFFEKNYFHLKIILYFCALELAPVPVLWEFLVQTSQYLEVNF